MPDWIFAYGSLLWNPEFTPLERRMAVLEGYHRSFCMLSVAYRGTETCPGLVLALDAKPGAQCAGQVLRPRPEEREAVFEMVRARELITCAYREVEIDVRDEQGETLRATTFIMDRDHPQYCDKPLETQAEMIARAHGHKGPNAEYLNNTVSIFETLGIADEELNWLKTRVDTLVSSQ